MKENYVAPEAKVIVLLEEDIVTLSSEDIYDNGENDQVWGWEGGHYENQNKKMVIDGFDCSFCGSLFRTSLFETED